MWYFILLAFALVMAVLATLLNRKKAHADIRATLGIKAKAGPMAVRLDQHDTYWAAYEAPTFIRLGLSLEPSAPVSAKKTTKRKPKAKVKESFTPVDQAELASLMAHYQQQGGAGFEVVA